MKRTQHKPTPSTAILSGFDVIDGTPPGPSDPTIGEFPPFPNVGCVAGVRTPWRPRSHCRARKG